MALPPFRPLDPLASARRAKPAYVAVFALTTLILLVVGVTAYLSERRTVYADATARLRAVAELRVAELGVWRRERVGDGLLIQKGPGRSFVAAFLRAPNAATERQLVDWFTALSAYEQYDATYVLDAQGRSRLAVPASSGDVSRVAAEGAVSAMQTGEVRLLDFFRDERDQQVRLAVAVPIRDEAEENRSVGAVVLSIDPRKYLNVYVTTPPLLSHTGETALLRRRGPVAEHLVPLRFDRDAALTRQVPLDDQERIVTRAMDGQPGWVTGTDREDRPGMGWVLQVPDSPWYLLVRQQVSEVDERVIARLRVVMLVVALLLVVSGAILLVSWRRQYTRSLEQEVTLASALSEEMARLQLALQGGGHGLWNMDLETGLTLVNPEYGAELGLTPAEQAQGTPILLDRFHPEDRPRLLSFLQEIREDRQEQHHVELRSTTTGGAPIWIRLACRVASRDAQGRPRRVVGLRTDITTLKEAELRSQRFAQLYAALSYCNDAIAKSRSAEELYPLICEAGVRHGGMGLAWIGLVDGATGRVRVAAAAGEVAYLDGIQITVDPSDAHGQGPTGTAIRENRSIWIDDFTTNPVTAPWRQRAAAHSWTASASLPIRRAGRAIGALMFYTRAISSFDEADRKLLNELGANLELALDRFELKEAQAAAEARLQASEARYRSFFTDSSVPMLLIDPKEGRIVDANLAAAEFYGWYRDTLVTMKLSDINVLPAEEIQGLMQDVLVAGRESCRLRHRRANGELRDVDVFAGRIQVGDQVRVLSSVIDVTARVSAERLIENAMREKDALLKEVHHRVKNNLQVITSLLRLEGGRSADPVVKRVTDDMQNRLISMALLHEMLYRTGTFAHVDLAAYLGQLLSQLFRSVAPSLGVTLAVDLSSITVDMDTAVPCGLMVNELMSNALKHAFPAGRSGEIRVSLKGGADHGPIRLSVADTGVGFPDAMDPQHGETLGLKLVASLARQLRGTLEFSHGPGAAVTFVFEPKPATTGPAGS